MRIEARDIKLVGAAALLGISAASGLQAYQEKLQVEQDYRDLQLSINSADTQASNENLIKLANDIQEHETELLTFVGGLAGSGALFGSRNYEGKRRVHKENGEDGKSPSFLKRFRDNLADEYRRWYHFD